MLWRSEQYPTRQQLAKAVGLNPSRIGDILEAAEFRKKTPELDAQGINISTRDITSTRGIQEPEQRKRILQSIADGKIKSSEIEAVARVAKTSDALLDKVLEGKIKVDRAEEATNKIIETEKERVNLILSPSTF